MISTDDSPMVRSYIP